MLYNFFIVKAIATNFFSMLNYLILLEKVNKLCYNNENVSILFIFLFNI